METRIEAHRMNVKGADEDIITLTETLEVNGHQLSLHKYGFNARFTVDTKVEIWNR